jgi:UDP:flavonoid glycosyltransferase YjiC (YdhE family)
VDVLLKNGHTVCVAAEGAAAALVGKHFPGLEIIPLRGYRIGYSAQKYLFTAKIITQVPGIIQSIRSEHRWLQQLLQNRHFDFLISDNRYGLHHPALPTVIMTHQLLIKTKLGKVADGVLQKWHYRLLEHFRECWIVDQPGSDGLSGKLAQPEKLPKNGRYIGLLSQLALYPASAAEKKTAKKNILVLLSGPEPMRSIFEENLLRQIRSLETYTVTFVAGVISNAISEKLQEGIRYHSQLHKGALKEALQQASLVICRSGYSTVMDLALMGKKALFVPTPGQSEQEYLAHFLKQRGIAFAQQENKLNLSQDILKALEYPGFKNDPGDFHRLMKASLDDFMKPLLQSR